MLDFTGRARVEKRNKQYDARKARLIQKAQKAGVMVAFPQIFRIALIVSWKAGFREIQRLRYRKNANLSF